MEEEKNNIIIYQAYNGKTRIDVKIDNETVWLSQQQWQNFFLLHEQI